MATLDKICRLVYNDGAVIHLFETDANSTTATKYTLFEGTEAQCRAKIAKLKLTLSPEADLINNSTISSYIMTTSNRNKV